MARAARERAAAGLPRLSTAAKTCSPECSTKRRERWTREWWARIKDRRLVAKRPVPEPWRCAECGIDAGTADVKRRRLGLPPIRPRNVVCGPKCAEARERRRFFVRYGRWPPRRSRR